MRCPKCGFHSFDYLDECGKCGADLARTRHELGMLSFKPAIPSFLGPLLKDHGTAQAGTEREPEIELDAFADSKEVASASLDHSQQLQPAAPIDVDLSEPLSKSTSELLSDDDIAIDFSDEAADWSLLDTQMDEPAGKAANLEDDWNTNREKDLPCAGRKAKTVEQNGVIELSEEDLEGLVFELEDPDDEKS